MGRHKKEQTHIKSFRVHTELKDFLESLDNANIFVIQLLEDTDEFKKFIQSKRIDTKSLFEQSEQ